MSNIQATIKVAEQIVSRIFDQRQFTSGEIDFISKEFGSNQREKSIELNLDRLLKLNQNACVLADTNIERLCDTSLNLIEDYCKQIDSLNDRTKNLLDLEKDHMDKEINLLAEVRHNRLKRKEERSNYINDKITKLKDTLIQEELDLERKYLLFEENLRKSK